MKRFGPTVHDLISSGVHILDLRVHGPKWHRAISLRTACVFKSIEIIPTMLVMSLNVSVYLSA